MKLIIFVFLAIISALKYLYIKKSGMKLKAKLRNNL